MRTLVVDDDPTSRFVLQEFLTPYGEVHSCVDGAEAIQAFQRALDQGKPYQLICLDIMMPYASGVEVLQMIRHSEQPAEKSAGVKILMTTALNDPGTVVAAFHEQCDGYLVKPIRKAEVLKQLRELGLTT
jgi:two-component system chemotaxis response regulator CheY